jgi:hypothetical protein
VRFTSFGDGTGDSRFLSGVASNEYFNAFGDSAKARTLAPGHRSSQQPAAGVDRSGAALLPAGGGGPGGGGAEGDRVTVRVATTLSTVLDRAGAPTHVDFLSLDCEGLEADVLETFPWSARSFGAIVVDHGYVTAKRLRIAAALVANGYVRVGCLDHDDAYVPRASLAAASLPASLEGHGWAALADTAETCAAAVVRVRCEDSGGGGGESVSGGVGGFDVSASGDINGVRSGGEGGGGSAAVLEEEHLGHVLGACRSAGVTGRDECLAVVLRAGKQHCDASAPPPVQPSVQSEGAATALRPPRYHSFPFGAEVRSPGDFTVCHLSVAGLDPGASPEAPPHYLSFPLFPTQAARAAGAEAGARAFCDRRRWPSCGGLVAFCQVQVEGWVATERARALAAADAALHAMEAVKARPTSPE